MKTCLFLGFLKPLIPRIDSMSKQTCIVLHGVVAVCCSPYRLAPVKQFTSVGTKKQSSSWLLLLDIALTVGEDIQCPAVVSAKTSYLILMYYCVKYIPGPIPPPKSIRSVCWEAPKSWKWLADAHSSQYQSQWPKAISGQWLSLSISYCLFCGQSHKRSATVGTNWQQHSGWLQMLSQYRSRYGGTTWSVLHLVFVAFSSRQCEVHLDPA